MSLCLRDDVEERLPHGAAQPVGRERRRQLRKRARQLDDPEPPRCLLKPELLQLELDLLDAQVDATCRRRLVVGILRGGERAAPLNVKPEHGMDHAAAALESHRRVLLRVDEREPKVRRPGRDVEIGQCELDAKRPDPPSPSLERAWFGPSARRTAVREDAMGSAYHPASLEQDRKTSGP